MSHVVVDNPHGLDQQVSTLKWLLLRFYSINVEIFHYAHVVSTEKKRASLAKSLAKLTLRLVKWR